MEQSILKKLQETELHILVDFDRFCREHELHYYLIGGALLGAARYQGFIPWDDDIDVAMPREDYEKLKEVWKAHPWPGYFLQHAGTEPSFARGIMKVRKNGTSIIENTAKHVPMNTGIYIDIFPIDYAEAEDFKKLDRRAKKIRRWMSLRSIKAGYLNGRHSLAKALIRYGTFFLSARAIDERLDSLCRADNDKARNYAVLFLHNYDWTRQFHEIATFGSGSICRFEGYEFTAPADMNGFLTRVFGEDYMKEPEASKRIPPHNYISIDFGTPAKERGHTQSSI